MNPLEFLQENIFYTPEKKQQINEALRRTQAPTAKPAAPGAVPGASATKTVLNKPAARKAGDNPVMDFIQDNVFYTPEKKKEINNALVESQSRNPAMFRPDPISLRDVAGTATGVLGALGGAALGLEPTLEGGFTAIEGGFREGKKAGQKLFDDTLGAAGVQSKPKFADLRGSATPGSMMPAADNSAADKAFAAAAKSQSEQSTGTDTGSGDREVTRVAQTDDMDANMKIWAAANPTLAANLVKKVDERRMNSPEYTQVGYDQAKKQVDPSYDPSVRSQNFGPVANGEVYGRNLDLQGTAGVGPVADGALYADMISGKEKPNADKASDFLNNYKAQLSGNLEPFAETVIPSQSQNPVTFGGDGTPIDSELQVGKAIVDFEGDLNKNISNRFRAF